MKILNVEAITRREKYLFDVTKNKTDRKQNLKIFLQKFRASTVEILPNEFLKKTQFSKVFRIKEIARSLLGNRTRYEIFFSRSFNKTRIKYYLCYYFRKKNLMQKKKLIIYGIGRFARFAAYVFNNDSQYIVNGYSIESSLLETKSNFFDSSIEYIPFEKLNKIKAPREHHLFIAVGNNLVRERLYFSAKQQGFELASYLSSKASIWQNLEVGENCFIGEGCVLQPFVKIGSNSILLSTGVGHHSEVGKHTLLSATSLAGNVKIGDYSFLGLNSAIQENIKIGHKNIIGMGTVITSDTEDNAIYTAPTAIKRSTTFEDFYRDLL